MCFQLKWRVGWELGLWNFRQQWQTAKKQLTNNTKHVTQNKPSGPGPSGVWQNIFHLFRSSACGKYNLFFKTVIVNKWDHCMVIVHKIVLTSKESLQFRNNSLRPLDVTLSLWHWQIVKLVGRCFPIEHSHSSLILLFFFRTMTFPVNKHNHCSRCYWLLIMFNYWSDDLFCSINNYLRKKYCLQIKVTKHV